MFVGYAGGSFGGYGGMSGSTNPGEPYGSLFTPTSLGSGGSHGAGGGHLTLTVGSVFHVDGVISVAGQQSTAGTGGGGSGGSILIEAYNMTGHGDLDASGGSGTGTNGGGGSGGRIGIEITFRNKFGGNYVTRGGDAGNAAQELTHAGASGTTYKYESSRGPQYRELKYNPRLNVTQVEPEHTMLIVHNDDLDTDQACMVMEDNSEFYEFDEVQIEGYSKVWFYHPDGSDEVNVVIHELKGNKQGDIHMRDRQVLVVNFVESTHTYLDAPCGFTIDSGAEIVLPTEVVVKGESFVLGGMITGVEYLYIDDEGGFTIVDDAQTGELPAHIDWTSDIPYVDTNAAHFRIPYMTVNNGGSFMATMDPARPRLDFPELTVKNGGELHCDTQYCDFEGGDLVVEVGGLLSGEGAGYHHGEGDAPGTGNGNEGGGGGHGGHGGNTRHNQGAGGSYYGDFLEPNTPGSPGYGSNGGSGGSAMHFEFPNVCTEIIPQNCGTFIAQLFERSCSFSARGG